MSYTELSRKVITTRKPCVCGTCRRDVPAKSQVEKIVSICEGSFCEIRLCTTCTLLIAGHPDVFFDGDVFWEGCVKESLSEDQTPEDLLAELDAEKSRIQE